MVADPPYRKNPRCISVFAVFAAFAGNYQRTRLLSPQKSWAGDGLANKRTAESSLFRCCIEPRKMAKPEWFNCAADDIGMSMRISE
jgi:hypothetical protein